MGSCTQNSSHADDDQQRSHIRRARSRDDDPQAVGGTSLADPASLESKEATRESIHWLAAAHADAANAHEYCQLHRRGRPRWGRRRPCMSVAMDRMNARYSAAWDLQEPLLPFRRLQIGPSIDTYLQGMKKRKIIMSISTAGRRRARSCQRHAVGRPAGAARRTQGPPNSTSSPPSCCTSSAERSFCSSTAHRFLQV